MCMTNKISFLLVAVFFTMFANLVKAQDGALVQIVNTSSDREWQMDVCLENPNGSNYTAFQFDVLLPKGVSLSDSVGVSTRLPDHQVTLAKMSNGLYRVIGYSLGNVAIVGNSGSIVSLTLQADESLPFGTYQVVVMNFLASSRNGEEYNLGDCEGQWEYFDVNAPVSYDLVYMVDGVEYSRVSLVEGETIVPPANPVKEGYSFVGWDDLPETMPAEDVTVHAVFQVNSYKVSYYVDEVLYEEQNVEYGSQIPLPDSPEKEGHTFVGWEGVPETMPAEDIVVNALFQVNSYIISYYIDGVFYKSQNVEYGAKITPPEVQVEEGRIFSGWSGLPEYMPAQDLFIYGTTQANSIGSLKNDKRVDVYSLQGVKLLGNVSVSRLSELLPHGIYIVGGRKILIDDK